MLTGGRSTRMGTSKAELFLPRILAEARPVFDDVLAMDRLGPDGVTAPIYGVQAALQLAQGRCFILAVDYPLITSAILRDLRDRGGVPMWNERPQPLCAAWDAALLPLLGRRIAEGKLDLIGLLAEAKVEIIAESVLRARHRGEPLMNVNTPEELAEAERLHG